MAIVNRLAPVLAVLLAFCAVERSAHFLFAVLLEIEICCREGSAFGEGLVVNVRWGAEMRARVACLAAVERAKRAGAVVSEADMMWD